MISMTGFGCREINNKDVSLIVEIRSYNSRYLEINVNAPPWLLVFEPNIREAVSRVCYRGKIDVVIRIREHNLPVKVSVNIDTAQAYKSAIDSMAKNLGIREKPGLALLLNLDGVLEIEKNRDNEGYWKIIEPVFTETLTIFNESRIIEGKHTEQDIIKYVSRIETSYKVITSFANTLESSIKETIKARFNELLEDKVDENRILAETAVLLLKYTISEEISRLGAHLNEFRKEISENLYPGKKLDFICQEINREINTIGSKSNILEVSRAVIEIKDALENIREQLRNVE